MSRKEASRTIATSGSVTEADEASTLIREWAPWVIGAVLVLMAIEWWVGHQRPWLRRKQGDRMRFDNPWWLLAAIPVLGSRLADRSRGREDGSPAPAPCGDSGCAWSPSPC